MLYQLVGILVPDNRSWVGSRGLVIDSLDLVNYKLMMIQCALKPTRLGHKTRGFMDNSGMKLLPEKFCKHNFFNRIDILTGLSVSFFAALAKNVTKCFWTLDNSISNRKLD